MDMTPLFECHRRQFGTPSEFEEPYACFDDGIRDYYKGIPKFSWGISTLGSHLYHIAPQAFQTP